MKAAIVAKKWQFRVWGLIGASCAVLGALARPPLLAKSDDPAPVDFKKEIEPLFKEHCHRCHGADKQEAGLRLDRKNSAVAGGESGPLWERGKPDESRLIKYVKGETDDETVMPPDTDPLEDEQISLLKRWIKEGPDWPDDEETNAPRDG